jgi:transposase
MTGRGDLSEAEWRVLEPLLPVGNGRCGRWRDHRQVVNGIWRDLPERYGPWKTVYERHRRCSADGTWELLLLQARADAAGGIGWDVSVDSTSVRAHQHAAGARHALPPAVPKGGRGWGHQSERVRERLVVRLAEVVREVRLSAARAAASPPRST